MSGQRISPAIVVCDSAKEASLRVAQMMGEAMIANPQIVLGLATGSTPIGVYEELVRMHHQQSLDFSRVTTFNLDEYVGLGPTHPQSYRHFMQTHLFDHVNVVAARTHIPDGLAQDIMGHAVEYENWIHEAGGIDLQLLGIGDNGHIGFNEPGSPSTSRTRQVDLAEATVQANSRFFASPDEVPRHAITMGIATILEAKQIILMATGERKADVVARAIEGPIDESCPASQLQKSSDVTFILDRSAAGRLTL